LGTQGALHVPFASQVWPLGQVPQVPPQPSGPQVLPLQLGTQRLAGQELATFQGSGLAELVVTQESAVPFQPQDSGAELVADLQACCVTLPVAWSQPMALLPWQHPTNGTSLQALTLHWPLVRSQTEPDAQVPQLPPQPSEPHDLPLQLGVQAALPGQVRGAPAGSRLLGVDVHM